MEHTEWSGITWVGIPLPNNWPYAKGTESQWGSCTDLVLFMDRTESTEQHPNDGQVIITSSHMQTGISCLQTETKLWACNHSEKACTCHGVQGWNNPIKSETAVNTTHLHRTAMLSSLQYKICYHGWESLARARVRQGESMNFLTTDGKYWKILEL